VRASSRFPAKRSATIATRKPRCVDTNPAERGFQDRLEPFLWLGGSKFGPRVARIFLFATSTATG